MNATGTVVVAVVGIDGCGKSSAWRGALDALASRFDVVGIGDDVVAGSPGMPLHSRRDVPLCRATRQVTGVAKRTRFDWAYRQLKTLDLIGRSRMRDHVVEDEMPSLLLTDGDPLVNTMAWSLGRLHHDQLGLTEIVECSPDMSLEARERLLLDLGVHGTVRLRRELVERDSLVLVEEGVPVEGDLVVAAKPDLVERLAVEVQLHAQRLTRHPVDVPGGRVLHRVVDLERVRAPQQGMQAPARRGLAELARRARAELDLDLEALALTRQWRKALPPSIRKPDPFDIEGRSLLRMAAHYVLDADLSGSPDDLRWAEACLRTWLKGATP